MGQEYHLQVAVVKHINSAFIGPQNPNLKFFHVANQNRDATEAFFNQKLGVLPGVSDLLLSWPLKPTGKGTNMGALELKAADGKLSAAQNRFLSWVHIIGWYTGTAKTVKQVHDLLLLWGLNAAHHAIVEPDYTSKEEKFDRAFDWFKP